MTKIQTTKNEITQYTSFVSEIKDLIHASQYEAMKTVNTHLLALYWEIGARITLRQSENNWGDYVVDVLAEELQKEFPGSRGYSRTNLYRMQYFYNEYSSIAIVPPSVGQIEHNAIIQPSVGQILPEAIASVSWSKHCVILERCKDQLERQYYMKMTKVYGWTKDVLINKIEGKDFERFALGQTNFDKTLAEKYRHQAKLAVKDEYNFDFLELGDKHSEKEMELSIIKNIRKFLIEMGSDFSFIGSQHRIEIAETDYFIDLLLFHRKLRSLIAVELKVGEFIPEYSGKMQFYLNALDEKMKQNDENPSIGIIICKSKNKTRVEYALRTATTPIGVATYSYTNKLPKDIREQLPSPETLAKMIESIDQGGKK